MMVGRGICTYIQTNNFGPYTKVNLAQYVDTSGNPITGTSDIFTNGTTPCPTPNTGSGACINPPLTACNVTTSDVNNPGAATAGVRVQAQQTFSTYVMGIFGMGTYSVVADATSKVTVLNTASISSPFIACGPTMRIDDDSDNNLGGTQWNTYTNSGSGGPFIGGKTIQLIKDMGNGGTPYDIVGNFYSDNIKGAGVSITEINSLGATAKPNGPSMHIHGTSVKGDCGASNNWKGLSCVADETCTPDPPGDELSISIPTASPYYDPSDGTNGNKVGNASNNVGPHGCGVGVVQRCIMLIPIAASGNSSDVFDVAQIGAFWVDFCYSKDSGQDQTCGWFVPDYTVTGGTGADWTYGSGTNTTGPFIFKLTS